MRVTHIIAGGRHGGAETFFVDLVDALARRGFDQHAFSRPYADRLTRLVAANCTFSTARMGGPLDFFSGPKFKRTLLNANPDIVFAWMSRAADLVRTGPWINIGRLGGFYDLKYYKHCDFLICNTPALVAHCIGQGWESERVAFIPNFSPRIDCAPVSKESLSTPEQAPVVLILARLEDSKGIDTALRAVANVPEAYLWIAGDGSQAGFLKKLAQSLGIQARVRFLGWRTDREALLETADVCLVPSRHEPFGNVVVNAWGNGTPVVATNAEGPSYLITDQENGLLVDVDDYHGMAVAVSRIVAEPKFAQRLAIGGESQATTDFSEDTVVDSYVDLFVRLMNSQRH